MVGLLIVLNDAEMTVRQYSATGTALQLAPEIIRINMVEIGMAEGMLVTLDAAAGNGIVAENDGGVWPGVTGFPVSL